MPRPRTVETILQEIVDLIYARRQKCYQGGTLSGSCINQPEWERISAEIEKLNAEARALKAKQS